MNLKLCLKCDTEIPENAKFCNKCRGTEFQKINLCIGCNEKIPREDINFCPSCGKKLNLEAKIKMKSVHAKDGKIHACNICLQKIKYDLVVCPSCLNTFHFNHLANWILSNSSCPICKVTLELMD